MIEIWTPKYSTDEVLIGTHHVQDGFNDIMFTKAKHLSGQVFRIEGNTIKQYPKQKNGRGYVYVVPFSKLTRIK